MMLAVLAHRLGSRTSQAVLCLTHHQRYAWVPFFENVKAIIFLAPLSCFNETLAEDPKVNRLEDTRQIWQAICGSSLLAESTIILFLNKIDLLDRKLRSGVRFSKTVKAYDNQPNDVESVVQCEFSYPLLQELEVATWVDSSYAPQLQRCACQAITKTS
jgi:hypothetical protein